MVVLMSSIDLLRCIANSICSKYGALCFFQTDPDELVVLGFTWVENFYYIDPVECARDSKCIETVFEMHYTVLKLAREGKYSVDINIELLEKAVKRLLELKKFFKHSPTSLRSK